MINNERKIPSKRYDKVQLTVGSRTRILVVFVLHSRLLRYSVAVNFALSVFKNFVVTIILGRIFSGRLTAHI